MNRLLFFAPLLAVSLLTSCLDGEEPYDATEQFHKEQAAIDAYLKENGIMAQVDSTHDLRYTVETQGTGKSPKVDSYITVTYEGRFLTDGTVFDENDSVTFSIPLGNLIRGWQVLLPHIQEGGKMTMYIPSYYGYGNVSYSEIPANSTLIFDVELHRVETKEEFEARAAAELFEQEQKMIDEYLEENNLTAQIDTIESLRYIIKEEGTGDYPTDSSRVNVDYMGKLLEDDKVFGSNTDVTFNLNNLIRGWGVLMPYVSEGGTIVMFLPSRFAYGSSGSGTIPPNTPLIFEVKLNEVLE